MRIFTLRRPVAYVCAVAVFAAMVVSCGGNPTVEDNKQVDELQMQLDSTMQMYLELKSQNGDFDSVMAQRDSVIKAQAAEIQRLINNMKNGGSNVSTSTVDNKQVEKQQKEIRDKENTIKRLQKQLDDQSKQLKALQSSKNTGDNGKADEKRIAQLQKQIAQQEKQISDLKAETKRLEAAASSKNTGCDEMKKDYESQVAELKGEIGGYKTQIADLNKQIKSLESEYKKVENDAKKGEVDKDDAELKATKEELRQLTVQLNECRKLNTQYQNDVKAANDNLASMTEKEAAERAQNEELKKNQQTLAQRCENDKQALQAKISDLQSQVFTMQTKVEQLQNEKSDSAKGSNDAASAKTIADLTAQVEQQRKEIERLNADLQKKNKELASAKSAAKPGKGAVNQKLNELQEMCDSYAAEIERLRAENAQLKSENAELKEKVSSSATLVAENERLQQKVKLASVLVTSDLKATPGKSVKVGNVVKSTTKASQTNYVRLDCRLMDNNVIDPGSVTIYARISNAADRAICNGNPEDYSFNMNGVQMQYTTKQDIEFTGMGRNLTMLWKKAANIDLGPGLYWVKLYANGYEIGKTSFKLE